MSKKKKPEQIQYKKYRARGLFNPLYSNGINGIPPHIKEIRKKMEAENDL